MTAHEPIRDVAARVSERDNYLHLGPADSGATLASKDEVNRLADWVLAVTEPGAVASAEDAFDALEFYSASASDLSTESWEWAEDARRFAVAALHHAARFADERAKDGRWQHAVRVLAALAEQKYTELGTVNEDIQYSVDAIVVRDRTRDSEIARLRAALSEAYLGLVRAYEAVEAGRYDEALLHTGHHVTQVRKALQ